MIILNPPKGNRTDNRCVRVAAPQCLTLKAMVVFLYPRSGNEAKRSVMFRHSKLQEFGGNWKYRFPLLILLIMCGI